MLERKDIFMGKRVNTPYGLGMITVMPYNEHTDMVFVELDRPTFDYFPKDVPQKFVVVSFKMMEEPEFAPVPEKIRNHKVFRYHAYRFIPAGTFADFGIKDDFYETMFWQSGRRAAVTADARRISRGLSGVTRTSTV